MSFGGERTVTLTGDDNDPDREQPLAFRIVSLPNQGMLRDSTGAAVTAGETLAGEQVRYTPAAGFAGVDSFSFVAVGGGEDGTSDPADVTLNVDPNSAPTANFPTIRWPDSCRPTVPHPKRMAS